MRSVWRRGDVSVVAMTMVSTFVHHSVRCMFWRRQKRSQNCCKRWTKWNQRTPSCLTILPESSPDWWACCSEYVEAVPEVLLKFKSKTARIDMVVFVVSICEMDDFCPQCVWTLTCCITSGLQSGRNALVLQQTYCMQERSVSLDNMNSEYVTELGYELLMQGKIKDAMRCYRNAMKLDESSVSALTGQCHQVAFSAGKIIARLAWGRMYSTWHLLQMKLAWCSLVSVPS